MINIEHFLFRQRLLNCSFDLIEQFNMYYLSCFKIALNVAHAINCFHIYVLNISCFDSFAQANVIKYFAV